MVSNYSPHKLKPFQGQKHNLFYQTDVKNVKNRNNRYINERPLIYGKLLDNEGWFKVRVKFITNEFKEFIQVRAYNAENLIGNSGGYIGLLVGYTIAQMPRIVTFFIMKRIF